MTFGEELVEIMSRRFPDADCTFITTLPARNPKFAPWPEWVPKEFKNRLAEQDIHQLFEHQVNAAEAIWRGENIVIATGTSSGKSLAYQLPIASTLLANPNICALYITPTKALGSDQLHSVSKLLHGLGVSPAPYDGDTPTDARSHIRDTSRWVFTNPDMLHAGILTNHERWGRLFRHLQFVIVDECHAYRGVFGAHISLVLRRLRRIAARYGSTPQFIFASATTFDPATQASTLAGVTVRAFTEDTSPSGERTVALWEPGVLEDLEGEHGAPVRRGAGAEAARLMASAIAEGARTLTFARSRRQAETTALRCAEELAFLGKSEFTQRIAAYRAGYLAEDRRRIEQLLDSGELLGVAATSALELGIDIGGLDAVITAGFPGTVASFWQQAGRAGRRQQGSLVVLIARDEPMDHYLVHHPEALLERPIERSVFDPTNPYVLRGHLVAAAYELPLSTADIEMFQAHNVIPELESEGILRRRARGWFPVGERLPVDLRGSGSGEVLIVDSTDGRVLGTVDASRARTQLHPGAVYLHQGETFLVDELNFADQLALVHPEDPGYITFARTTTDIRILETIEVTNPSPGFWVAQVNVEVTEHVIGYVSKLYDGTQLDLVPLNMPAESLQTRAVAYTVDPECLQAMGIPMASVPGALHAAEHAAIGILPLIATCDRWDIGGVSTALHQDTGLPTVFVYDGHPGGAGFAECGFKNFAEWIQATFEVVSTCPCESGCPMCIQSPKCGNGNSPLSKEYAIALLGAMHSAL
ncbi:DEAD/DEAH box helicase [Corynebacterium freiburgense]|uniref:DEAD/DEAH box helicase n=1 Tax=Corynebacterium freiburgense TaxID=556548 RepID=UPI00042825C9|nr:DEAD/DEAH box helicase [Corynebacterium freiburgense]WJZ01487.1 putative ATP-dependent helicase Lhr [Corynebacterium freiburgense]